MSLPVNEIDWSLTTWEGSRRAQLRDWMQLSLTEKWLAVEEMADFARETVERLRQRGLPYIDPYTRERIPGSALTREELPDSSKQDQDPHG